MMPSATTQTMKPKIGFSIESIVGVRSRSSDSFCEESEDATNNFMTNSSKLPTLANINNFNDEYSQLIKRARRCVSPSFLQNNNYNNNNNDVRDSIVDRDKLNNNSDKSINNFKRKHSQSRSPSPVPQHQQKPPIHVPGIMPGLIRPQHLPAHYPSEIPHGHNPHLMAQFQALANVQAAQVGFNGGHLPQHFSPHLHNPNLPRESYQLYPWLLSRHGRLFPHRFPGNFLLQPFRKPKRVRTAFSPTQLLKLEHAFEGNHYVVGAERKTLAQQLNLTETQVKVWFQNRRTKHKRTQQEDGDDKSGNKSSGSPRHFENEEDELEGEIDVDEYPSDDDCGDNDA